LHVPVSPLLATGGLTELGIESQQGLVQLLLRIPPESGFVCSGPTADANVIAIEKALGPTRSYYVVESIRPSLEFPPKRGQHERGTCASSTGEV
jgi:hypothetical protein